MSGGKRYLVVTLGSAGDLHPPLTLARALRRCGCEVEVMSNAPYREVVEAEGLRFTALCSREDHERTATHPDLWHPIRGFGVLWRHLAVPAIDAVRERVAAFVADDPRPGRGGARVLASPLAVGARLVRMQRDFPLCSLYTAPANLRSVSDPMYIGQWRVPGWVPPFLRRGLWWGLDRWKLEPMARPALRRAFAAAGLAPKGPESTFGRWIHSPDGGLTLFPEWFCPRQVDWPTGVAMGDFPLFESSGGQELESGLDAFLEAGGRPVVIFPGSVAGDRGLALVRQSLTACRALGLRAIVLGLSTPMWNQLDAGVDVESVYRCAHAPLGRLLPRARVFIHHGGIGSCAQGLTQRIPQLICPSAFDQFDNAERVEIEGGGRTVVAGKDYRARFLGLLEELSGGGAGAILNRAPMPTPPGETKTADSNLLSALQRWEDRLIP